MATKTITITEEAYDKLKLRKHENESFSDVINRTMPFTTWTDFIGILSKDSADKLKKSIDEGNREMEVHLKNVSRKLQIGK